MGSTSFGGFWSTELLACRFPFCSQMTMAMGELSDWYPRLMTGLMSSNNCINHNCIKDYFKFPECSHPAENVHNLFYVTIESSMFAEINWRGIRAVTMTSLIWNLRKLVLRGPCYHNEVFPKWSRIFNEFSDFNECRESEISLKHELV